MTQLFFHMDGVTTDNSYAIVIAEGIPTPETTPQKVIFLRKLTTSRGAGVQAISRTTVTGPTAGLNMGFSAGANNTSNLFVSPPVSAAVTISGSITFNIWGQESSMNANAVVKVRLFKISNIGVVTTVHTTTNSTELGTSSAVANFSESPSSFTLDKGDRIGAIFIADDASGVTMGSGFTVQANIAGTTGGVSGDTYFTTTETLTFDTSTPAGSVVYLTDTDSIVNQGIVEKEAWTARGAGVQDAVTNTQNDPANPIPCTQTAGGTAIAWYTKPLQAFTLSGPVQVRVRAIGSNASCWAAPVVEIAVVNNDGSSPTVFGINGGTTSSVWIISVAEDSTTGRVTGQDIVVTDGQRIRIRVMIDDGQGSLTESGMNSGFTVTCKYAGTSDGASGDSFVTFTETLTEQVIRTPYVNPYHQILAQ